MLQLRNKMAQLGRDAVNIATDHLFGDLGLFCRATFVKETDIASKTTEYTKVKSKICNLHILERLDFFKQQKNGDERRCCWNILVMLVMRGTTLRYFRL